VFEQDKEYRRRDCRVVVMLDCRQVDNLDKTAVAVAAVAVATVAVATVAAAAA
jgi:hypothetical protein